MIVIFYKFIAELKVMASNPPKFTELNDLTCEDVGGKIIFATDDWFACKLHFLELINNRVKSSVLHGGLGSTTYCGAEVPVFKSRRFLHIFSIFQFVWGTDGI